MGPENRKQNWHALLFVVWPAVDANVGRSPGQVLSHVVVVWGTHRGGLVSRVFGERSEAPMLTLNLWVIRRYYPGEGGLVSTRFVYRVSSFPILWCLCACAGVSFELGGHWTEELPQYLNS